MFRHRILCRVLIGMLLSAGLGVPAIAADLYKLDPFHTAIVWHISHFGFSNPSGKFMNCEGTLVLDEKNPAASKINVTIPIASVDSGVPALDEHLRAKEFFDTATYPTATFVSDKVELGANKTAIVHGTLTLRGVAKPVALHVKLNKSGANMMKVQTVGFTATTTLNRSDFGMTSYLPGLGDAIQIDIESEANLVPAGGT